MVKMQKNKTHNDRCHDGPVDQPVWNRVVVYLPASVSSIQTCLVSFTSVKLGVCTVACNVHFLNRSLFGIVLGCVGILSFPNDQMVNLHKPANMKRFTGNTGN